MPRLGLVTTSYPRWPGDYAGGFVAEHAAYLASVGWEVDVVAAGAGTGEVAVTRVPSRLFYEGGAPEALDRGHAWRDAISFTARLTAEVRRRAPTWDAVVAHWLVPGALAAMVAAPRLPLLAIAHSGDVHTLRRLGALAPFGLLAARRRARLSFVTSELRDIFLAAQPRRLRRRLAAASQVCPMGVDLARLRAARHAHTIAAPAPTVLFLGRLVPVKGVETLVAAARLWRSETTLVIAGAGPDEPALRRLACAAPTGRIAFTGEVSGAARDSLIAAADIVALPSVRVAGGRSEGMPLVALEAMAARAALVASAVGGLAEIPAPAVTHVPPGDPHRLAAAVDLLAREPARRLAQLAAQDAFVAAHDWRVLGARLAPHTI